MTTKQRNAYWRGYRQALDDVLEEVSQATYIGDVEEYIKATIAFLLQDRLGEDDG